MARRHGNTRVVDQAPPDQDTLASYFIDLSIRDLRLGWVACVIDALVSGITLGALARAVTVVSRRLYGVRVDERTGEVIDVPTSGAVLQPAAHPLHMTEGRVRAPGGTGVPPVKRSKSASSKCRRAPRLTDQAVRDVRAARAGGESVTDVAARTGISISTISRICNGLVYQEVK
jgi:hypothetical protein